MIPLNYAVVGEENVVKKVGGNPEMKHHLENLGFVPGAKVTLIGNNSGNIIVSVKEARIAIGSDAAMKIMI